MSQPASRVLSRSCTDTQVTIIFPRTADISPNLVLPQRVSNYKNTLPHLSFTGCLSALVIVIVSIPYLVVLSVLRKCQLITLFFVYVVDISVAGELSFDCINIVRLTD